MAFRQEKISENQCLTLYRQPGHIRRLPELSRFRDEIVMEEEIRRRVAAELRRRGVAESDSQENR